MGRPEGARNLHTKYEPKQTKGRNALRGVTKAYRPMSAFERELEKHFQKEKKNVG